MQKSNQTAIAGVIIFGILAVGLTIYALTSKKGDSPPPNTSTANTVTAAVPKSYFVATREILPRTRITRDMLTERQSNGTPIPDNAITDPFQIVGQLANKVVEPGQILTTAATVQAVTRVIPANIPVPPGLRAVAIWVNPKETAAGLVDVGDRVDVISTNKLKGSTSTSDSVDFVSGRTIAQDLQVLAVDKSINTPTATAGAQPAAPAPATNQPAENSDASRTRLILAASPQQAQRITAANAAGILNIAIRNPGDSSVLPTGESLEYPVHLVSIKAAAAPPAPPAPPAPSAPSAPSAPAKEGNNGPIFPPPTTGPPIPITVGPAKIAPPTINEVTVIRGTEKSVVAVPK